MSHEKYMERAFVLANKGKGRTSPNPMVGAVLVKDGHIVGEGFTSPAGGPHAEAMAIMDAGEDCKGSTCYVSLEPCSHYGRTAPCAEALIDAGIKEVYSAIEDPSSKVNGKGHRMLENAGISVKVGLGKEKAFEINKQWFKYINTGRPWITAKFAVSLDGKLATSTGESQWITNEYSRNRVHQVRNMSDAILVGSGTVLADNPRLTTRISDANKFIRNPLRIVVDSAGSVPLDAHIFDPKLPGDSVLATTEKTDQSHYDVLLSQGISVWVLPQDDKGRVDLGSLLDRVGQEEIITMLVEGGSILLGSLVSENLIDHIKAFVAPIIIGGKSSPGPIGDPGISSLADVLRLDRIESENINGDILIEGDVIHDL